MKIALELLPTPPQEYDPAFFAKLVSLLNLSLRKVDYVPAYNPVTGLDSLPDVIESGFYLQSDGSIKLDVTYTPSDDFDIATKNYVDGTVINPSGDYIPVVTTPTVGNFPQLDADGELVDSIYDETSFEAADSTILKEADVDDVPVNGADTAPVSSNRMYDHEDGTAGQHAAADITYDNTASGLTATNAKTAIDEVVSANPKKRAKVFTALDMLDDSLASSTYELTAIGSSHKYPSRLYTDTSTLISRMIWRLPDNLDTTENLSAVVLWSHTAATAYGVRFNCYFNAIGDGEALDISAGSAASILDTGGTTDYLYISPEVSTTSAGTIAAGEMMNIRIDRTPTDANDTLDGTVRIHELIVFYHVE